MKFLFPSRYDVNTRIDQFENDLKKHVANKRHLRENFVTGKMLKRLQTELLYRPERPGAKLLGRRETFAKICSPFG